MACKIHSNKISQCESVKFENKSFKLPLLGYGFSYIEFDEAEVRDIQRDLRTVNLPEERRLILDSLCSYFIKHNV